MKIDSWGIPITEESIDPKYDASVKGSFNFLEKQKAFIPEGVKPRQDDLEDAWDVFLLKTGDDLESEDSPDSDRMKTLRDQWDSSVKKARVQSVSVEDALNWDIMDHGRRPKAEQQNNPIIVGKSGNEFHVLDGAHRVFSANERGEEKIKALMIDLDWADMDLFESVFSEQKSLVPEAKISPQKKALDRVAKLGVELNYEGKDSDFTVVAKKNGKIVGSLNVDASHSRMHPNHVEVDKKWRRKGIATAMYVYAEMETGNKFSYPPDDPDFNDDETGVAATADAVALWDNPKRPFGEQKALIPEAKGDWKKEGIKISDQGWTDKHDYVMDADEDESKSKVFRVVATKSGKQVGIADIAPHPDAGGVVAWSVKVDPKFRRLGVATAMYQYAEKKLHDKMEPFPGGHSKDAQALWDQPKRRRGFGEQKSLMPESVLECIDSWGIPVLVK